MFRNDVRKTWDLIPGGTARKALGCFRSPGVHAVAVLRFGQWVNRQPIPMKLLLAPLYVWQYHRIRTRWGIEIPRDTEIGEGLYIGHYGGITVSSGAKIGRDCYLSQQVTIGISGSGDRRGCPTIGDSVYIAPGARIFGKIVIGDNVSIGANAVVHADIPDNSIVRLAPGFEVVPRTET